MSEGRMQNEEKKRELTTEQLISESKPRNVCVVESWHLQAQTDPHCSPPTPQLCLSGNAWQPPALSWHWTPACFSWRASVSSITGSSWHSPFVWSQCMQAAFARAGPTAWRTVRAEVQLLSLAGCPCAGHTLRAVLSACLCFCLQLYLLFWGKSFHRVSIVCCTHALFQREERCYLSRSLLLAQSGLVA